MNDSWENDSGGMNFKRQLDFIKQKHQKRRNDQFFNNERNNFKKQLMQDLNRLPMNKSSDDDMNIPALEEEKKEEQKEVEVIQPR